MKQGKLVLIIHVYRRSHKPLRDLQTCFLIIGKLTVLSPANPTSNTVLQKLVINEDFTLETSLLPTQLSLAHKNCADKWLSHIFYEPAKSHAASTRKEDTK